LLSYESREAELLKDSQSFIHSGVIATTAQRAW